MGDLVLYLTMAVIGYFCGCKLRTRQHLIQWTGKLQTVAIILLIFTMGMRMGANPEVIENLNTIGLYALVITVFIIFFSVVMMIASRKLMGMDRFGTLRKIETVKAAQEAQGTDDLPEEQAAGRFDQMTLIIVACVIGGLAFGHVAVPALFTDMTYFANLAGTLIDVGLCILLYFVGFDMGVEGTALQHFRQVGLRVLLFPLAVMVGTLIGAGVCAPFLSGLSLKEALAVGAGFGWYTFAPGIIMEAGHVTASAISFMHNVMREFISVLIVPLVAKKVGYLESVAVPACSSMDVCLPIIERSTRSDIAIYAFISGVVQSAAVPILVPLIIG